ncbi:Methyltransferase domain-containing protein [Clostridium cavendishii DSM 21758]|uniref:Methyltransferase domain-containing protein n=1 Tax=Clostridium cavendishii DSM 21758 TaxID=1121302 RepID=A0A1M6NN32_9CLOT|nr:class I SAM-dependent methyltransferase [Clostridium cavendishii]SHJ96972.1 Methyltransferase domain-containing protein [Clostridium cavendishii DSM 21758]
MELKGNQKEYWNKVATDKQFTTPFQIELFSEFVDKQDMILDVGCGYGRTLNELYFKGFKNLFGIDFSSKMIARGKEQFPWLNLNVKEDKKIAYADNSFDSIILFAVLTCIVDDEEQVLLMDEIKRVLKPNGILYINDFLLNTDERNVKRYKTYKDKYNKYGIFELPEGAVLRHHDLSWIEAITSDFNNIKLETVIYTTMNGNKSNGFFYLGKNNK